VAADELADIGQMTRSSCDKRTRRLRHRSHVTAVASPAVLDSRDRGAHSQTHGLRAANAPRR